MCTSYVRVPSTRSTETVLMPGLVVGTHGSSSIVIVGDSWGGIVVSAATVDDGSGAVLSTDAGSVVTTVVATVVALATIPLLAWPIVDGIRLWREGVPGQPARGGSLSPDSPPSTAIV